ncbi:MAG: dihydroneopterin aldolase [Prevotella sp.]|nr:dihydroneopterin aldolase [Prevotella sp.]
MRLTSSYILLHGLRFHAFIGVGEQERRVGNDYVLDLRLGYPVADAMKSDDVADTLNYAEAFTVVKEVMSRPAMLLEAAAWAIASELSGRFPKIESIDLKLMKCNPPMGADCDGAGVELHLINDKTRVH